MFHLCELADLLEVGGYLARLGGTIDGQLHLVAILPPDCQIGGVPKLGILVQTPQWFLLAEGVLLLDEFHIVRIVQLFPVD